MTGGAGSAGPDTDETKRRTVRHVVQDISACSGYALLAASESLSLWWAQATKWPPDIFALTSVLLEESGAYCAAVSPPDEKKWPPRETWNKDVKARAKEWRASVATSTQAEWLVGAEKVLQRCLDVPVRKIIEDWELTCTLIELHVTADEACGGVGMRPDKIDDVDTAMLVMMGNEMLGNRDTLSNLSTDLVRVLPKMRTPQCGMTLRSMSGNLALCPYGEVDVKYASVLTPIKEHINSFNLLLLPVPLEVRPKNFCPADGPLLNMDEKFRFFRFEPEPLDISYIEDACHKAKDQSGGVQGIILPELACSEDELKTIQALLVTIFREDVPFLLAGVRGARKNSVEFSVYTNEDGGEWRWRRLAQPKHHRWCLDRTQIDNYHVGAALHPRHLWWEDIALPARELRFIVANSWFGLCPLICEDLARQDPVAQIVRTLGPPLVIALLLDGPQFEGRWPGRYATVLADDPGSSVLTFTALGMASRCVPEGKTPSRVVGLWKDARNGPKHLELAPAARSLLLTICNEWAEEFIADGRGDGKCAANLYLANVEQLS
jgi:hypothetical protein